MKKINIWTSICAIVIIIIFGIVIRKSTVPNIDSIDYLTSKEDNVSITKMFNEEKTKNGRKFDFDRFDGKWSLMEFQSTKDNKIKIIDNSKITKGILYIVVLSSEYKAIATHKSNGKASLNLTTPKNGKYFIRIVGKGARGNLNIKINSTTDVHLSHRSIFE
ncbi:hypothetical protein FDF74_03520 [Clostridium niameyense]|uniref:Uncharacterized protein n=1 Tax=Clostridium niameyense TaxID=1622073 RepID=A0A6M0R9E9_9CLOT|nr:hypothetical protein [Clostridium niameyense]NEZ46280.1 hypothetical protein [Clostridium niameyense]